jgi:hypothetical protein
MSDAIAPGGRPLSEAEIRTFEQLGASPGNWAALVTAPFFDRPGLRPPAPEQGDGPHLERLRRAVRTQSGLGKETGRVWKRLVSGGAPAAASGTRLLAWHLATDVPFARRELVLRLIGTMACGLQTEARPGADRALVADLRLLIDYYLPCRSFPADAAPRWTPVPVPSPEDVRLLAPTVDAPEVAWPPVTRARAAAQLPALVGLLGEPVAEWWGRVGVGARAVERGLATVSYAELAAEWERAHGPAGERGAALVDGMREWVEAARKFARRDAAAPRTPVPEPPAAEPPDPPPRWACAECGRDNSGRRARCSACGRAPLPGAVELHAPATGKALRVGDGMRVGRGEYREVFGAADAGLAAADQFELVRDVTGGAWRLMPVAGARHPTCYQGAEVAPQGCAVAADGVISVGGRLELVVRFV